MSYFLAFSCLYRYDAITVNGELDWQNKLNKYNKPFFDLCDGLFANYTWKVTLLLF
jgi:endo-beta-N-acetylglucosaminidase D